ncbi:MAG: DUF3093 domain-containing protein [Micrococcales bacterium]|nr:DUF3093 domain-containing protein [Micrococcales bacterium]NBR61360.1 DUF3093 domain-containing protein [Actinomycetota bacterium]NBR54604.1 DUF3093 domain-containing protein [Micrococcales bacterium]NBT46742.1 DUF3093 domain-containing protein [Actinomycetota bacterium]NBY43816.1 DUF3093 domain-containing protein [Micrococcales bacterium]
MAKSFSPNRYRELALPGPSYFFIGTLIAASAALVAFPLGDLVVILTGIFTLVTWTLLGLLTAKTITIDEQNLKVGKAVIPRSQLGLAEVIGKESLMQQRGPKLNSLAYVQFQSGVQTMVKVEITDQNDPTPYWLFSSRQPEIVAGILNKS